MEIMTLESHTVVFDITFNEGGALIAGSLPGHLNYFLPSGSYICRGWSWLPGSILPLLLLATAVYSGASCLAPLNLKLLAYKVEVTISDCWED